MKKLWVAKRASEDREEWMEEVQAHCERCDDDKDEMNAAEVSNITVASVKPMMQHVRYV